MIPGDAAELAALRRVASHSYGGLPTKVKVKISVIVVKFGFTARRT